MSKKLIIFDMDGVIIDSGAVALATLQERYPDMTNEILKDLLTGNFHEGLKNLTLPQKVETPEEISERQIRYAQAKTKAPVFSGIPELLADLHKKGYLVVLNTSAYNRNTTPVLQEAQIIQYFNYIGTAEVSKNKAGKFKIIQDMFQISTEETLFITDTLGDVREADVVGVPTVAVTWGAHDHTYFTREPHANLIGIVDTIDELRALIEQ